MNNLEIPLRFRKHGQYEAMFRLEVEESELLKQKISKVMAKEFHENYYPDYWLSSAGGWDHQQKTNTCIFSGFDQLRQCK